MAPYLGTVLRTFAGCCFFCIPDVQIQVPVSVSGSGSGFGGRTVAVCSFSLLVSQSGQSARQPDRKTNKQQAKVQGSQGSKLVFCHSLVTLVPLSPLNRETHTGKCVRDRARGRNRETEDKRGQERFGRDRRMKVDRCE